MNVTINSSSNPSPPTSNPTSNNDAIDVTFVGQTTVNITHNKSTKPIVNICNNIGQQIFGEVIYSNVNSFTINFNSPQSGLIRYI